MVELAIHVARWSIERYQVRKSSLAHPVEPRFSQLAAVADHDTPGCSRNPAHAAKLLSHRSSSCTRKRTFRAWTNRQERNGRHSASHFNRVNCHVRHIQVLEYPD